MIIWVHWDTEEIINKKNGCTNGVKIDPTYKKWSMPKWLVPMRLIDAFPQTPSLHASLAGQAGRFCVVHWEASGRH